jgi:hypothetical protein
VLSDPNLDPKERLRLVLEALGRAHDEWDEAQRVTDDIDPMDEPEALGLARRACRDAYRRWFEISNQAAELAEQVRRTELELRLAPALQRQRDDLIQSLREQFDGGPHYDLLCERVASLTVRLQSMEASGRQYAAQEHAALNGQLLTYVNQLQKYTEAMKSESISREAQSVAEQILALVERHCATTYPELWLGIMKDVRGALEAA